MYPLPPPPGSDANLPTLGLVVPAYSEAAVLPGLLADLARVFTPGATAMRLQDLLVVDDGSPAGQAEAMRAAVAAGAQAGLPARYLAMERNHGKGRAVRTGWLQLAESCDYLAFMDADGAVSAREFARCLAVAAGHPGQAVFASRVKMRGRKIERCFKRHLSGRLFATLVGRMIDAHVYDSQCGCKILPSPVFRAIHAHLQEDGFVFDVELLAALNRAGIGVLEVPVDWIDKPDSKVRLLRDSWRMLRGVWRIRQRFSHL